MPVLPLEPYVYPEELLEPGAAFSLHQGNWWVIHTKPRAEKALARRLHRRDISFFLPMFQRSKRSNGRVLTTHLPLFPGYLFLRGNGDSRLTALETNLVVRCLPVADGERLRSDLTHVLQMMRCEAPLHPENRMLPGSVVEIIDGPLAGLTGKVLRIGKHLRFFVEVHMLQRGVSVQLERWMFRPLV
jgi:transcription antitermination factor NusG